MARNEKPRGIGRREFLRLAEEGRLSGAWLLEGDDDNLRDEAISQTCKTLLAEGMESLDSASLTAPETDELISACETMPFMSPVRIVLLRDQPGLTGRAEADEGLCGYMERVPATCLLLIVSHGTADRRKRLPKAMDRLGHVVRFDPMSESELQQWILARFDVLGKVCDPRAARELMAVSGTDSTLLAGEVDKLAAMTGGDPNIPPELVRRAATHTGEYNVFRMVDAIVGGRAAQAVALMRELLTDGQEPLGLLAMMLRQYRLLQNVKILQLEKVPRQEYDSRLSLRSFQTDQLVAQASRLSGREVRDNLEICLDTEYRVKSGRLNDRTGLEAALIRIIDAHAGQRK